MKLPFLSSRILYACLIVVLFGLVACKKSDDKISSSLSYVEQVFPQDLLHGKVPIHPLCIITALNEKSPQPISLEALLNLPDYYDIKDHTFSYDLEKKTCEGSWKECRSDDYAPRSYATYRYIGPYKNGHIIQTIQEQYGSRNDLEKSNTC